MNKLIMLLKVLIIPLISFIVLPLIFALFNLVGLTLNKIILIILSTFIMIISGFIIGKKSKQKGFISGGLLGLTFIFILIILGMFFKVEFSFSRFIYYSILILSSIMGSIIGINKKKSN